MRSIRFHLKQCSLHIIASPDKTISIKKKTSRFPKNVVVRNVKQSIYHFPIFECLDNFVIKSNGILLPNRDINFSVHKHIDKNHDCYINCNQISVFDIYTDAFVWGIAARKQKENESN